MITRKVSPLHGRKSDLLVSFDSLSEFSDFAATMPKSNRYQADGNWAGSSNWHEAHAMIRTGDDSRVARSDQFMSGLEIGAFDTKAYRTIDSVCGGVPNVANYLAGNPMAMRSRRREESAKAPLNIVVDLASSGGISAKDVEARGAAILALVRILSGIRPVSLWLGTGLQHYGSALGSAGMIVRMDSAPLDITRAAHMLCNVAVPRLLFYDLTAFVEGIRRDGGISFPYGMDNLEVYRTRGHEYWARLLDVSPDDTLFIPQVFLRDHSITNHKKWVIDTVAKYGRASTED